jgi:hypothetical protein
VARYEAKIWRKRKIAIGLSVSPCGFFLKNVFPAVGNFQGFDRVGDPGASNGLKRFAPEVFYPSRKGDRPEAHGGAKKLMVD